MIFVDVQLIRKEMVKSAKECMKQQATQSKIYGRMQTVFIEMDSAPCVSSHYALYQIQPPETFSSVHTD